jgi:hypothetical protein
MRNTGPRSARSISAPVDIDPGSMYEDAALRWRDFKDRIGPAIVSVVNFARVISESDTFEGDKLATVGDSDFDVASCRQLKYHRIYQLTCYLRFTLCALPYGCLVDWIQKVC